jgi:hypothetical protein
MRGMLLRLGTSMADWQFKRAPQGWISEHQLHGFWARDRTIW